MRARTPRPAPIPLPSFVTLTQTLTHPSTQIWRALSSATCASARKRRSRGGSSTPSTSILSTPLTTPSTAKVPHAAQPAAAQPAARRRQTAVRRRCDGAGRRLPSTTCRSCTRSHQRGQPTIGAGWQRRIVSCCGAITAASACRSGSTPAACTCSAAYSSVFLRSASCGFAWSARRRRRPTTSRVGAGLEAHRRLRYATCTLDLGVALPSHARLLRPPSNPHLGPRLASRPAPLDCDASAARRRLCMGLA